MQVLWVRERASTFGDPDRAFVASPIIDVLEQVTVNGPIVGVI